MKRTNIVVLIAGLAAVGAAGFVTAPRQSSLVVHEWGTFTSLQGSDGVPLKWNPLESSKLPGFVYNWTRPGLGRRPTGMLALGTKSALVTLHRMETQLVYFYTPKETRVDLTIRFPQGGITEWYPQSSDVGPSVHPPNPFITSVDSGLHSCGIASSFSMGSLFEASNVKESVIHWPDLTVLPAVGRDDLTARLPQDSSGSHYFAARETDSAFVQLSPVPGTNSSAEFEKFLFYRGVGNFVTPLHVEMQRDGVVNVSNTGVEPLAHLFILGIQGERGELVSLERLKSAERKSVSLDLDKSSQPLANLRKDIQAAMVLALETEGLYPREAAAMVKTWQDSWFTEQGIRVLYVLPRSWTERTLLMSMDPKPTELVRVMVGRAEVISVATEKRLARELAASARDQAGTKDEFSKTIAGLGRFAQPALDRALDRADLQPSERNRLWNWFSEVHNRSR